MRLPLGVQVRHLQASGSGGRELRMELHPPGGDARQPSVSLEITRTLPTPCKLASVGRMARPQRCPPPRFSTFVKGSLQLRLTPSDAGKAIEFESAPPIQDISLDVEMRSLFVGSPLIRSSLRAGELHLGQRAP